MTHAKRTDSNQAEIVAALRATGCKVIDKHACGFGVPDLLVQTRGGIWFWLEVKQPGEKLTTDELDFFDAWPGDCHIARSPEEAVETVECLDEEMMT